MAHVGTVKILEDKSTELSLMAEYLKNPKLIEQLADDVKKLNALSVDEEKKAAEARALIQKHQKILDETKTANTEHEANKTELAGREADLNTKVTQHDQAVEQYLQTQKNEAAIFEGIKQKHIAAMNQRENVIKSREEQVIAQFVKLDAEKAQFESHKSEVDAIVQEAIDTKAKYEKKLALIQNDVE